MLKLAISIILIISLAVSAAVVYVNRAGEIEVTNASFTGRIVRISATREGIVGNLHLKKGDHVTRGDLLFSIESSGDDSDVDLMIEQLRAAIATEIDKCMEMTAATTELTKQSMELANVEKQKQALHIMSKANYISGEELRSKDLATSLLSASLELAAENLDYKRYANRLPIMERATTKLAAERLRQAYRRRYLGNIYAPYSGYIYEVLAYPGQYVDVGHDSLVLVPDAELLVEVNVLETQLQYFHPGVPVRIIPDVFQDQRPLKGVVHSMTPAVSATFSSFPRNNSDSTWIKVSQRVPVLITVTDEPEGPTILPLGSSVKVIVQKNPAKAAETRRTDSPAAAHSPDERSWEGEYRQKLKAVVQGELRDTPQQFGKTCAR